VLPHPVSACLAAPLDVVDKVLLTDLCNRLSTRAPVERSISGRAACAAPTAEFFPDRGRVLPCSARPSCDDPTPAESTLDGVPLQLRSNSRTMKPASSPLGTRSVGDRRAVPLHTGLVDPGGAGERPLTPTSPPSVSSTEAEPLEDGQDHFHRAPVKELGFPDPGCLPSTRAPRTPLSREVCLVWEPATDLAVLPRTIRLPALFHSPLRSRAGKLDPSS
jgi:hypothetical protein